MMVWDLIGEDTNEHGLPPGFRFHPSDEELISFYLASKVFNGNSYGGVQIVEVDLNRCEPWELPDVAKMGEREWYFYSLKDRKYPTGLRTNRATGAGYWKATGKDREVYSSSNGGSLVGMKKTLVFYKGRAPRGEKTKWVLHEYRLDGELSNRHACKEEWVICRIFQKAGCEKKNPFPLNHGYYIEPSFSTSVPFLPSLISMNECTPSNIQTLFQNTNYFINNQLPQPPLPPPPTTACSSSTSHANITSLLKPHQNHTPLNEMMIPVTKQFNIQTIEEEGGGEDGILNWLDYSNQHNPFLIDLGLFNSCLNSNACGSSIAVHDISFPFPPVGESQPLVP